MIYSSNIQRAIRFAIKTHEVYQKQKRKGGDIPYIVHPFSVALILSRVTNDEDIIIAGILHDTIEDSSPLKKVDNTMIEERFGKNVLNLVLSVTEEDRTLSWEERKRIALMHVSSFSYDSILLKSADVIANNSELIYEYKKQGDLVFEKFNASKEKIINSSILMIEELLKYSRNSPLLSDLSLILNELKQIKN